MKKIQLLLYYFYCKVYKPIEKYTRKKYWIKVHQPKYNNEKDHELLEIKETCKIIKNN